jgi:hypothetical protein
MTVQTEFAFTLPHGYIDAEGNVHLDEIGPMKDPRVQTNPGYLVVILLSRVISKLGELPQVNPKVIEGLFAADFAFLQDFYRRINLNGHARLGVSCPECEAKFEVEMTAPGE